MKRLVGHSFLHERGVTAMGGNGSMTSGPVIPSSQRT